MGKDLDGYLTKEGIWMEMKQINRHSRSLVIRQRQMKTSVIHSDTPIRMVNKSTNTSDIAIGNVKQCSYFGKQLDSIL